MKNYIIEWIITFVFVLLSFGFGYWFRGLKWYRKHTMLKNQNEALKEKNTILLNFFGVLLDDILKEVDKDGWCRLVIKKEKALDIKERIKELD